MNDHHGAVLGLTFALVIVVGVGFVYSSLSFVETVPGKTQTANVSNIPLPPPLPEPPAGNEMSSMKSVSGTSSQSDVTTESGSAGF